MSSPFEGLRWCRAVVAAVLLGPVALGAQRVSRVTAGSAGGPRVVQEAWTVADGLPVNSITHLLQTKDGYIWAATFDGLVRFDGARFTTFRVADRTGLPSDRIVRLWEGAGGDVWLATEQRQIVRLRRGRFTTIVPQLRISGELALHVDADGTTWIGTDAGLLRVAGDSPVRVAPTYVTGAVTQIIRRSNGTLLVLDGTRRLVALRTSGDRVTAVAAPAFSALASADTISALFEDAQGTLWAGTRGAVWSGRDALTRTIALPAGAIDHVQYFVAFARSGELYAHTTRHLLRVSGVQASVVDTITAYFPAPHAAGDERTVWHTSGARLYRGDTLMLSLPPAGVAASREFDITAFLMDREGSIWLGTFAAGLRRVKPSVVRTISVEDGLRERIVYPTYVDARGDVWAGSWTHGIARIDPATLRVRTYDTPSTPANTVNTMLETRDGTLWIGGGVAPTPLLRCRREPVLRCEAERAPDDAFSMIRALHEDADGRLWVGTNAGVRRKDGAVWTEFSHVPGAPSSPVRAFARTRDAAIWMGTNGGGVVRYGDGRFTPITTSDGLPTNAIRALYEDADGWLWIGTEGRGLARLDPRAWSARAPRTASRTIATIGRADGLFDDVVHQVLEDDDGRLWMNSNRGIFWVARREAVAVADGRARAVHSTGYTERDGMRNREGNGGVQPAGARGRDGRLWFPTQDGVVVVDPRTLRGDTTPPPVVVEQVSAGDSAWLPDRGQVRLSARDPRDVRIEFTALTFLEPGNVRFRYRLQPYDAGWTDAGNRRSAFYTKLPPGSYTFEVQASGASGTWHEPGARLVLVIEPRVYETLWFRLAVVLAGALAMAAAVRRRLHAASLRARELEQAVIARTAELREREQQLAAQNAQLEALAGELQDVNAAQTRFFANVSHELRTPLTLTIGPLEDVQARQSTDAEVHRWVDVALRNSRRLLQLVNQILDVAKLESGAMRLSPQPLDVSRLVRGVASAFELVAQRKSVALLVDVPDVAAVLLDGDAMEKIVTNLMSNAVKFTPPSGRVALCLTHDDGTLELTVRNTGAPIPPAQLAHLFERFYSVDESATSVQAGTGIGLSLVKELVELMHGTIEVRSDAEATAFVVRVPAPTTPRVPVAVVGADARALEQVRAVAEDDSRPPNDIEGVADRPTLLVVDDSADLRGYIRAHFEREYRVVEAADGAEGIRLARETLPDVILSDVMMPGTDGHALVRALRASPDTDFLGIILLTAQADDAQKLAGLAGGADDYIVKPFEMRELALRVGNLMRARRRWEARVPVGDDAEPEVAPVAVGPTMDPEDAAYLQRVRDVIADRLSDPAFGVQELADAVFQDRSYLYRRVREVSGQSPSELVRQMRLARGETLLASSGGTVADVAYAVGFNSVSHFSASFTQQYGEPPSAYRAAHATEAVAGRRG